MGQVKFCFHYLSTGEVDNFKNLEPYLCTLFACSPGEDWGDDPVHPGLCAVGVPLREGVWGEGGGVSQHHRPPYDRQGGDSMATRQIPRGAK